MRLSPLLLAIPLLAVSAAAHADTYTTFNVNGIFQSGNTLSGTVTLDNTTDLFTSASITVVGDPIPFPYQIHNAAFPFGIFIIFFSDFPTQLLELDIPDTYSLTHNGLGPFAGSVLCSTSLPCYNESSLAFNLDALTPTIDPLTSGSITSQSTSPIPEPSTLALLGTGLLGAVGTLGRKLRQPA